MDKIIIRDLEVYAYHGVNPEEKTLGQLFLVSTEISAELEHAALTDDLSSTIDYGRVCGDIEEALTGATYDLIEAAALTVIRTIFRRHPAARAVKVRLKKPWAPLKRHLRYVAVEMERTREDE
jgi:dihydroneopterin aldolase